MSQAGEINVVQNHPEIPTMFVTDSGTAIPIANRLDIVGGHISAAGTPIHTTGDTNIVTVNIQAASAQASSSAANMGGASFNNTEFTVDANGFVSLVGGGAAIQSIAVQTGTSPIVPSGGQITFNGAVVAAGTHPVRTDGTGANTMALEVQTSQAIAATDATKIGLSAFDSARFTVDLNGFVSFNGSGVGETITGQSGDALSPSAGNWNIFGGSVAAGTSPLVSSGSGSTLTLNVQRSQAIASADSTKVGVCNFNSAQFTVDPNGFVSITNFSPFAYTTVNHAASPYTVVSTDEYISCDPSAGTISILLPNAPTTYREFVIKDRTGSTSTNNISVTTVGGVVTIDGQTTYTIDSNYASIQLLFNGTSYEVY